LILISTSLLSIIPPIVSLSLCPTPCTTLLEELHARAAGFKDVWTLARGKLPPVVSATEVMVVEEVVDTTALGDVPGAGVRIPGVVERILPSRPGDELRLPGLV